jgi:hypothetical protein
LHRRQQRFAGVHRTYLSPDGLKAEVEPNKLSLGALAGGCVALGPLNPRLIICEGVETGLSILQATGASIWAALSTDGMTAL